MTQLVIVPFCALALSGCGSLGGEEKKSDDKDSDKKGSGSTEGKVDPTPIFAYSKVKAPAKVNKKDKTEIVSEINGTKDFFFKGPEEPNSCDPVVEQAGKAKVDGTTAILQLIADVSDCLKEDNPEYKEVEGSVKVYSTLFCDEDVSRMDGMSSKELGDEYCTKSSVLAQFVQTDLKMHVKDATNQFDMQILTSAGDGSGEACDLTIDGDVATLEEACEIRTLVTYSNVKSEGQAVEVDADFSLLVMHDLVMTRNKKYYDSGEIKFTIANWTGTMTYSDPNTAPTYVAESDAGEKVSGSFAYVPD